MSVNVLTKCDQRSDDNAGETQLMVVSLGEERYWIGPSVLPLAYKVHCRIMFVAPSYHIWVPPAPRDDYTELASASP